MRELKEQVSRLRQIAELPVTQERRAEVLKALESKFEGIQAVALDVLGFWAGRNNLEVIKGFLIDALERQYGWAIRGVAIRNLIPLVASEDAEWILDLYFTRPDLLTKHELVQLVTALPPKVARDRLLSGLRSANRLNRQAAVKAIGNMAFPDRRKLLLPMCNDLDDFVRESAELLTQAS